MYTNLPNLHPWTLALTVGLVIPVQGAVSGEGDKDKKPIEAAINNVYLKSELIPTAVLGEVEYRQVSLAPAWVDGFAGLGLPAAIVPGSDGNYEPYYISGIANFPDNVLLVFNQHGQLVFKQRGYKNDWKGTDRKNNPLPQGRYFAIVSVKGMSDDIQAYVDLR